MPLPEFNTNYMELVKFHKLLLKSAPEEFHPFYFPLKCNGKEPLEGISWKKNRKTLQEACSFMKKGFNIGIAATDNDLLCIVDIDDLKQVPEIKPTLQMTSRKRIGLHNYFFAADGTAKKNIAADNAGEVRAVWQYVLAPGSYVPCSLDEVAEMPEAEKPYAGKYTLNNLFPAFEITFDELPEVYKNRYTESVQDEVNAVIRDLNKRSSKVSKGGKCISALWDLDITDVSGVRDTGSKRVPMPSEIHGSETGHNCSVHNGLLHCWRHEVAHNAFSYLAVLAGILSCERAGLPHGGLYFGVDFQDGHTVYGVWKYAKDHGLIPEDDPIPPAALTYYALQRGICKKTDLKKGWKLPPIPYQIALLLAKQEGLNFGRN